MNPNLSAILIKATIEYVDAWMKWHSYLAEYDCTSIEHRAKAMLKHCVALQHAHGVLFRMDTKMGVDEQIDLIICTVIANVRHLLGYNPQDEKMFTEILAILGFKLDHLARRDRQ